MPTSDIYGFLTEQCKMKRVRVESLPKRLGISRSTLYRYMKGLVRMPARVENSFIEALSLDETEKDEFQRLVNLTSFDNSLLESRKLLEHAVFSGGASGNEPNPVRFVLYDGDRYLRSVTEIFQTILDSSGAKDFYSEINIVGCLNDEAFAHIARFIDRICTDLPGSVSVEHLIMFSGHDYLHNIGIFTGVLPLLAHKNYRIFMNDSLRTEAFGLLLSDTLLIKTGIRGDESTSKYFCLSFLHEELSECYATNDRYFYEFFINNLKSLKTDFHESLIKAENYNIVQRRLLELERKNATYLLKPNVCYNRIPIEVFRNSYESMDISVIHEFLQNAYSQSGDSGSLQPREMIEELLVLLERRAEASHTTRSVDVCSKQGLLSLAKTGRLSDHVGGLPPFDNESLRLIFTSLRDRSNDPDDMFTLYIMEDEIFNGNYNIVTYDKLGVIVEYNVKKHKFTFDNVYIENKMLAKTFVDFIDNRVPELALPPGDATAFLNELIAMCE